MAEPDLIRRMLTPLRDSLAAAIARRELPAPLASACTQLVDLGVFALLACAVVAAAVAAERLLVACERGAPPARRGARLLVLSVGAAGAGLLVWIVRTPSAAFQDLFGRADHLALCAAGGLVAARLAPAPRRWTTTAVSLLVLWRYTGALPLLVGLLACVAGFGATRMPALAPPRRAATVHGALGALAYAYCWHVRPDDLLAALRVQGLLAFWYLRHLSYVIDSRHGGPTDLGGYLAYLCFYPGSHGIVGGPEVYGEFSRRNLGPAVRLEHRLALERLLTGALEIWLVLRIPVTEADLFRPHGTLGLWAVSLALFVRSALYLMGLWALVEAAALLWGVRLRRNFAGILTCENPAELWRSWRGSLTHWLVTHVYAPLGGQRRHQALNIAAAFAVSVLWHWSGIPFLTRDVHARNLLPITLWGAANAIGVIGYVSLQGRGARVLPPATPRRIRRATKILLTACLGTLAVTLPAMQTETAARLGPYLRTLLGLR